MHRLGRACALVCLASTVTACAPPTDERPQRAPVRAPAAIDAAEVAADRLRDRLLAFDAEGCARDGATLVREHPASSRLRAWWIGCVSAAGSPTEAAELATAMQGARPGDPWAEFARVAAWLGERPMFRPEALSGSEALVAALHAHPDALVLRARALLAAGRKRDLLALHAAHPEAPAWVRVAALFDAARGDPTRLPEALAVAHEVAPARPDFPTLAELTGASLAALDRPVEALAWYDAGLARAPAAAELLRGRWTLLRTQAAGAEAQRREAVLEDIARTVGRHGDRPSVLLAAAETCRALGEDALAGSLEARLLAEHGDGPAAETLAYRRLAPGPAGAAGAPPDDPTALAARRAALAEFLARPRHHDPFKREAAARRLMEAVLADPTATAEQLIDAVEGLRARLVFDFAALYVDGVRALGERTPHHDRAEALAREGAAAVEAWAAAWRRAGSDSIELARRDYLTVIHEALAGVFLRAGRLDDAAEALARAESASLGPYAGLQLKHAELARRRGDLDRAEEHLAIGLDVESGAGDDRRCRLALEALYRQRRGSLRGLEEHLVRLAARERARRRAAVQASLSVDAPRVPAFALRRLDGRLVDSDSLHGKIAVVHFWFKTCTGCLLELPAFQAFVDAHAGDPDLAIVSLHHGGTPDEVSGWMRSRGHRFDVLMDAGYSERAGVHSFPTTWFLDQDGRIRFTTAFGATRHLREEFEWRLDALRRLPRAG